MKTKTSITSLLLFALCFGFSVSAMGGDLEMTGFFDVVGNYQSSAADKTAFGLGQAQLDLENQLSHNANALVSVAYNNVTGDFGLRTAVLEINLSKNNNSATNFASISAGQFDVPFGIDYNVYSSIDRKLVSAPMAVAFTHSGWNDFGVQFKMNWEHGNFVAYGVNGFESSYLVSDAAHALTLSLAIGDEVNTTPANAFGTRAGFTPIENFEIGGSLAFGLNQSGDSEMMMFGGDLQYAVSDFSFKGEYIEHSLNRSIEEEKNKGYYFQALYNMNQFFLTGRYGSFQPNGADWVNRTTVGAGYEVANAVELRFETTINKNSNSNSNVLQLVGRF